MIKRHTPLKKFQIFLFLPAFFFVHCKSAQTYSNTAEYEYQKKRLIKHHKQYIAALRLGLKITSENIPKKEKMKAMKSHLIPELKMILLNIPAVSQSSPFAESAALFEKTVRSDIKGFSILTSSTHDHSKNKHPDEQQAALFFKKADKQYEHFIRNFEKKL